MTHGRALSIVLIVLVGVAGGAVVTWYAAPGLWPFAGRPDAALAPGESPGTKDEHGTHADEHEHADRHAGEPTHRNGAAGHGEDHADEHGHQGHTEAQVVRLSDTERRKVGVRVATAGPGKLTTRLRLPGEIVVNADRIAHVAVRSPGVVRRVIKSVGDAVTQGEVMAMLESTEIGEAKVEYLAKQSRVTCCQIDLIRAKAVHDNTLKMLEMLKRSPSLDHLRQGDIGPMGENRIKLVSAYAELVLARATYVREKGLHEKKITSEEDYLAAENAYKKAHANYAATGDSVTFTALRNLLEAQRDQRLAELTRLAAQRRLYVLGLTGEDVRALAPASAAPGATSHPGGCSDPNCATCRKAKSATTAPGRAIQDDKLAWYALRAPFAGTVIEKHASLGEHLSDGADAFTVADLRSVWANLSVYQKDLPLLKRGVEVAVSAGRGMRAARGTISYVAPIIDEKTRTGLVRVVLPNDDGRWRPGQFVSAEAVLAQADVAVLIPKSVLQRMDAHTVVFVPCAEGFAAQRVELGRSDKTHVEVRAGLAPGGRYVAQGAFELKAKLVTSGLDAHAGHGH